jgi:hypothetical protein
MRWYLVPPLVAGLALLAAGCGGGGGSDRLSKSEFITRADAICAKYEQRVRAAMNGVPAGSAKQLASAIERVLPVIRTGNDELRALEPPENLQVRFDRWMRISDGEVVAAKKLHDALRKNDQAAVQAAFTQLQQSDAAQDRLAREELGLKGCASGSGAG